jgi:hypothetical protein
MTTTRQQQLLLPGAAYLPSAAKLVLSLSPERAGKALCLQQVEALLSACLVQGYVGPLVLLLLHAAINLRLQSDDHPTQSRMQTGLHMQLLLGLVQYIVPQSVVLAGTPPATLDALQGSCYWWAAVRGEVISSGLEQTLPVSATTKVHTAASCNTSKSVACVIHHCVLRKAVIRQWQALLLWPCHVQACLIVLPATGSQRGETNVHRA